MGKVTKDMAVQIETIVYDKVINFIQEHRYPPTVRELQEICGFRSSSTAHSYLIRLEDKGLISRVRDIPRAMKISES